MLILQRYYFESESQHKCAWATVAGSCCLSYKDTILKANHSRGRHFQNKTAAVAYPTKILFWKRITAYKQKRIHANRLLLILQRYYFESESQHYHNIYLILLRCCLSYKDTILKANHSIKKEAMNPLTAVAYPTKILFWKRITAEKLYKAKNLTLLLILQRYYFESESQQSTLYVACLMAVAYPTKILFWKRITAGTSDWVHWLLLLLILQRYYFESESQLLPTDFNPKNSCCLSYKDTILKANHS